VKASRQMEDGGRPGLAALQSWLFDRVSAPVSAASARKDGARDAERIVAGSLGASGRLEIYRHAYFARLVECLTDDYPGVAHALGAAFEPLCVDFITHHPPPSSSLNFYGAPFARYCARRPEHWAPFASDLARLEWAVVEVIHADARATLDPGQLARLTADDWTRVRLLPSRALRLVSTAYPLHAYYQAILDGEQPEPPEPTGSVIAVCRRGDDIWRSPLNRPLGLLLERLLLGQPLLEALEGKSRSLQPERVSPAEMQRAFSDWVASGYFAGIALGE
jgi:Putative DNA-binding domain